MNRRIARWTLRALTLGAGLTAATLPQLGQAQFQLPSEILQEEILIGTQQAPLVNSGASLRDINPPLVSIGSSVGFKIEPEDYRLYVPIAAAGRQTDVVLYSPHVNLNDYANIRNRETYYGDELYGKGATLVTRFNLLDPNGDRKSVV